MFLTVNGVLKRFINNTNNKQKTTLQDFFYYIFFLQIHDLCAQDIQ